MSEKFKKGLDKTNKILTILCVIAFFAMACRITHYHISTLNDNSENVGVKIELPKENN